METEALFARWQHGWARLPVSGSLKSKPEDFVVNECADFSRESVPGGEHVYLLLQKRNQTTRELARELADANALPLSAIGYAGMKDKRAVTRQWFSAPLAAGDPLDDVAVPETVLELQRLRQTRKLRRGWHTGNQFEILLRDVKGAQPPELEERLTLVRNQGVPNYFSEQRFGQNNLAQAIAWLPRRRRERNAFRKGLYLSVLRSFLFNTVLSARIIDGSWNGGLPGEAEPTGPLWGRGRSAAGARVAQFEAAVLAEHAHISGELEFAGLQQERRALVARPRALRWQFIDFASLRLQFTLPPGCYATAVLRELGVFTMTPDEQPTSAAEPRPAGALL